MKFSLLILGSLLTANGVCAQQPTTKPDAKSLAQAETTFAHESLEKGTRTAFLDALSDDGIVFESGPQNGKKFWQSKEESSAQLQWQPVLAVVSASGDLGYTTGPWSYKKKADDAEVVAFGQFISIWRCENGKWKLLLDLGSENPKPTGPASSLQLVDLKSPAAKSDSASARTALLKRDHEYATAARTNFSAAAAEDVRVFRPGEFPAVGKAAAEKILQHADQSASFSAAKGEISETGDLGFAWGEYSSSASGNYLRVWRRVDVGEWKLALEVLHPRLAQSGNSGDKISA